MSFARSAVVGALVASQVALVSVAASQVVPLGGEFQANSYTTDDQYDPAVAADPSGNFVVVWTDGNYGGYGLSIQAQRYDANGMSLGSQFQVNAAAPEDFPYFPIQRDAQVAADAAGNFVVVWGSEWSAASDTSGASIQGRRYDAVGVPLGDQFQVNSYTTNFQRSASVASDAAGNFVVVWVSNGSVGTDSSSSSIQGQRYDSEGVPVGSQFQVNTYTTDGQANAAVTSDAAGNFVVVWSSYGSGGSDSSEFSIQGQRYDAAGAPQGSQFQVNSYTTEGQALPAVAADGAGKFVVVWLSLANEFRVQGQRYDAAGLPVGGEFQVNSYTIDINGGTTVAADAAGGFVVAWQSGASPGSDASGESVLGRRYDDTGAAVGSEFQVNSYTTGYQGRPAVAADAAGNFVVAWWSAGSGFSDQNKSSIQAQRFELSSTTSTITSPPTTSTTLPTTNLLPGRLAIIRPGTQAKFVAKPLTGDTFALPAANPVAEGGSLRIFDTASTAGDDSFTLPLGASWKGLGKPAGSKGYKYTGAGTPSDPCKVVLVKETVIKAVCQGSGVTLSPPFTGPIGIVLSLGTTDRYCAQFGGGVVKNTATRTKRKNAPAPGACP